MKSFSMPFSGHGLTEALAKLTHAALFSPAQGGAATEVVREPAEAADAQAERRLSLLDRIDDWFWRQELRDREAYLAQSADVFELEARIRHLERGGIY